MKKYCLDTSGLSNPLQLMPEDIYPSVWAAIEPLVGSGIFALTSEIYAEMSEGIYGRMGDYIRQNESSLVMEIGDEEWDFLSFINHSNRMQAAYEQFISERNGNRKDTLGMNDLSIIALARMPGLPVISMENRRHPSTVRAAIPDICDHESIYHMTFNDLLRAERITI